MHNKRIIKLISCIVVMMICISLTGVNIFSEPIPSFADDSTPENTLLYSQIPVTQFQVSNLSPQVTTELDYTDWWYSEWEDCYYIFLPATADRKQLMITYAAEDDAPLYLNGEKIASGEMTSLLGSADEFSITVGETDCGILKVMQSNLGCIYISTEHDGLDYLDSHWWIQETGSTLMLDAEGGVEYSGKFEKMVMHGNSSWDYSRKKPYNIKLSQKENLYGMGKAKKWALLGNYLDHSMLRNKVVLEMSRAGGMDYVMDSVFVDLYAGGSYRGTYQLSERVQIQKKRVNITDLEEKTEDLNQKALKEYGQVVVGAASAGEYMENSYKYFDIPNNPDDITGGYLLQFQLWGRYGYKAESGFVTSRGQAVEIDGPEYASKEQVLYIRNFVQELEDAIYSDTGYNSLGKHYSEYIDVDSLITAYLVQEISMNSDGTKTSFYFWKESDLIGDGKLHCGPAWDFDLSCNNYGISQKNSDGEVGYSYRADNLYITCFPIDGYNTDRPTCGISWIGQLYKRGDIVKRAAEIYFERFAPYLNELTNNEGENTSLISQMAEAILPSAEMNNARWHMYGGPAFCSFNSSSGADFMDNAELVRSFLEKRKLWLEELWQPLVTNEGYYLQGDVNVDGKFNIADVIMLQRWLLNVPNANLVNWRAADLYEDGILNVFDLCLMKKKLMSA